MGPLVIDLAAAISEEPLALIEHVATHDLPFTDIVTADSPGLTTLRVENFDHARADGPRWPIDPNTPWSPST